jgi:hypothetical protein
MADNTALNEALQNLEFTFAEQAGTILKTVINMDTTVFYEGQDIADAGLLAELATDEMVRVDAVFNRVLSGTVSFLLEKSLVAKIVDFMIMGDGQVEFMADEHLDGILEGVNQVMGAEITRLNGKLGVELRADVDKASVIPAGDLARTFDGWLLVRFTVEIEGQGSFRMFKLYESGLKDQLGRLLIGDTAQRGSEPAGRPAAASAGSAGGSSVRRGTQGSAHGPVRGVSPARPRRHDEHGGHPARGAGTGDGHPAARGDRAGPYTDADQGDHRPGPGRHHRAGQAHRRTGGAVRQRQEVRPG